MATDNELWAELKKLAKQLKRNLPEAMFMRDTMIKLIDDWKKELAE